ncbi:MAG: hypothetical protein WC741_04065 [Patescibacteria group bacterium]|jgi:hypothetical protein
MSKVKPQYFVSTDSIGFFGKPEQFVKLWKEYFKNKTLNGVEVIALKPINQLDRLIETFRKNNIPVLSFHGRTGGESKLDFKSRIIMTFLNIFIEEMAYLLKYFPEVEYLSHTPYFEKKTVYEEVIKNQPKKIWVENHLPGKRGVEDAIKQINIYRKNGVNICGMLDIYHYVAHSEKILPKKWSNTVEELRTYFLLRDCQGKPLFCGIHFPIGTRLADSLPLDNMTDKMLKLFAEKIIPHVERVVFENQQKNLGLFFSTNKMIEDQRTRNKNVFERLKKTGIIY